MTGAERPDTVILKVTWPRMASRVTVAVPVPFGSPAGVSTLPDRVVVMVSTEPMKLAVDAGLVDTLLGVLWTTADAMEPAAARAAARPGYARVPVGLRKPRSVRILAVSRAYRKRSVSKALLFGGIWSAPASASAARTSARCSA